MRLLFPFIVLALSSCGQANKPEVAAERADNGRARVKAEASARRGRDAAIARGQSDAGDDLTKAEAEEDRRIDEQADTAQR
jgi:hypothetical protein